MLFERKTEEGREREREREERTERLKSTSGKQGTVAYMILITRA